MRVASIKPLFAWDELEDTPAIRTLRDLLESLPDEKLLSSLVLSRGRGRNDYPVDVLWGTLVLTIALRHPTIDACLGELNRNPALRRLLGIKGEDMVPKKWNMSRFMAVLGEEPHLTLLHEVFDTMVSRLAAVVPDLGKDIAGDSSALKGRMDRSEKDPRRTDLPIANGGHKEYLDDDGNVTKIIEWFGYKIHLLVDRKHEVALAYHVTSASAADCASVPSLVKQAESNLPANRIKSLAYDKAADDKKIHALLSTRGIKPLIEIRSHWKEMPERQLPGHDGSSNVVYDECGTIYCYDTASPKPVRHNMSYIGHEAARGTLKYRCPAKHEGWSCPSDKKCNGGKKYGKTVRVKQSIDLRRFPPVPRATKTFERMYKERTSVERVNARLKLFWGSDDGNVTGSQRFHGLLGTVMIIHVGFATLLATAPRWEGTLSHTKLSPIAKALQKQIAG